MRTTHSTAFKNTREDGFTLTELFVVMVTVAILALLLLPALAGTKPNSQAFQCLENLRQLTLGWQMYAEDNNGRLTPNLELGEQPYSATDPNILPGGMWIQWCPGNMKSAVINQQTNLIMAGLIYPYVKNANIYKCPADLSVIRVGPLSFPKPRSYSMNCWLAPYPGHDAKSIGQAPKMARIFRKDTDLTCPGPALTFVFIDENETSIDDGFFCGGPNDPGVAGRWYNAPSTRHGNASGLSYADGHSEMKRWSDMSLVDNSEDNIWLESRFSCLQ
jgi:prepilin-type processing-associated H-X9-DG protein